MRTEQDGIGSLEISDDAFYGIHSLRAKENFIDSGEKISPLFIKSFLIVKKAALFANYSAKLISEEKFELINKAIEILLNDAEDEIKNKSGKIYNSFIVDPLQGGAGTSLNMNVNEVISNTALKLADKNLGDYNFIHPIDDVNLSQSTNDTFPTAFRIAAIYSIKELERTFAELQNALQKKENEFSGIIKLGRTQFQDAVPMTLGQEFGAYAQAIARDRWRLYNIEERLRNVNLGGTAIGNSINAERNYLLNINAYLKKFSGLPIAKAEDLIDSTQNLDQIVEVHGILKAGAVSIKKISNDLRLLSSGPNGGIGEINLPAQQSGSSIMPGKVNPVILENVIQVCELIKVHDAAISNLASEGNLELNQYFPMIAHLFLKSIDLLNKAIQKLIIKCINGITANEGRCKENLMNSSAIAAVLIKRFGYSKIELIAKSALNKNKSFLEELMNSKIISQEELNELIKKEIGVNLE